MRIAKCECYRCHSIVPKTEARQKIVTENSGHSGISFSIGLTRNARPRMNTGRKYYSNRKVWVCSDCDKSGSGLSFIWWFGLCLAVGYFTLRIIAG